MAILTEIPAKVGNFFTDKHFNIMNPAFNCPKGNYIISTSGVAGTDIPFIASWNDGGSDLTINEHTYFSGWCYRANGSAGATHASSARTAVAVFLPQFYDYDLTALRDDVSTIEAISTITITYWLKKI